MPANLPASQACNPWPQPGDKPTVSQKPPQETKAPGVGSVFPLCILVLDRIEEYIHYVESKNICLNSRCSENNQSFGSTHCVVLGGPRSESGGIFQRLGLVIADWFHSNRCLEDVYADPSRETRTVTLV